MCRIFLVETRHPVPTRFKHKFAQLFQERFIAMQVDLTQLPLEVRGGKCLLDYKLHGLYKLMDPDENGRILKISFYSGEEAVASV
eukprot:3573529-Lingulodinium_polyedra.AAC.1